MTYRSYARVSSNEQAADDRSSLEQQRQRAIALASLKGICEHEIKFYVDAGVSGATPMEKRPEGARLLADLQPGDTIVAAKLDRVFRSASDALNTAEILQKRKVGLILADIGLDPVTESGVGKLFFSLLAAFAEFERARLAERAADGRRGKKAKGGHTGGDAPYGYSKVGTGREAVLVPHPEEQLLIRTVYGMGGKSFQQVADRINRLGNRTRKGTPFTAMQIKRILQASTGVNAEHDRLRADKAHVA